MKSGKKKPKPKSLVKKSLYMDEDGFKKQISIHQLKKDRVKHKFDYLKTLEEE